MIDSHAHLQAPAFTRDLAEVLDRAAGAGITRILVPGWDLPSSRAALALAGARGAVRLLAAAGIHPHAARAVEDPDWSALVALAADPLVVAIGETGLDYDRLFSPREAQVANLRRHLALALDVAKPLVLHCRSAEGRSDAQDELLRELEVSGLGGSGSAAASDGNAWVAAFGSRPPAVLHSFSGSPGYAERALAMGLAVSFSGLVFRAGEEASAEVARLVPGDRLLVETDAPYLAPPGVRRRRNEPSSVRITASWLADRRAEHPGALEDGMDVNFEGIFGLGSPPG